VRIGVGGGELAQDLIKRPRPGWADDLHPDQISAAVEVDERARVDLNRLGDLGMLVERDVQSIRLQVITRPSYRLLSPATPRSRRTADPPVSHKPTESDHRSPSPWSHSVPGYSHTTARRPEQIRSA
jgi:hypothetical protein